MQTTRAAILALALAGSIPAATSEAASHPRILAFTKTGGFRHESIPVALRAVRELGAQAGLVVDSTESASAFSDRNLARYAAVVFLLTTGDVLDARRQAAFERFIRAGGGFAGVHSASDTEYDWPFYGGLVGAYFSNHPAIQQAAIDVVGARHPSTAGLPRRWTRTDEWYNFARPPSGVRILATLDETSYSPGEGAMGDEHPFAWAHEYEGGRAWYTAGGHTDESYSEPLFRRHLLGGIRYAAGLTPPRVESVTAAVRGDRLRVTVRYSSCQPCAGELRVRVRGRWSSTPLRLGGGTGRATSGDLPPGRWQYAVVLKDPDTGLTRTVRRWVRLP
jgi:type 1 glutamine amidotransferase